MEANHREFALLLGYFLLQNNRPDKAAILLNGMNALTPDKPELLRMLACALIRSGKPNEALGALDQLAMLGQMDAAFHLLRAQALFKLSRKKEAQQEMQLYIETRTSAHLDPSLSFDQDLRVLVNPE